MQVEGAKLSEVLANLNTAFPGFDDRLFDETGGLRKFVNVFVADDDVRYLDGLDTAAPDSMATDADVGARILAIWEDRDNREPEPSLGPKDRSDFVELLPA